MKFLESHRAEILIAFDQAGFTNEEFHFVKRKGRIISEHRNSDATFSYFRRNEVSMNWDTQTLDSTEYFEIRIDGGAILKVESWDAVMASYREWLEKILK